MAICYFGVGNYQETDKLINEIYKVQPKDNVVTKLRRALEIAQIEGSDEEVESLFKEVEMSALTGDLVILCISLWKIVNLQVFQHRKFQKESLMRNIIEPKKIY
jgi:hypothetical protein